MSFAAAFLSFGAKKKQGVTPTSPLLIFLFLHFLYLTTEIDAYGGGQRPLVRSRTAAVRSE